MGRERREREREREREGEKREGKCEKGLERERKGEKRGKVKWRRNRELESKRKIAILTAYNLAVLTELALTKCFAQINNSQST